MGGVGWLWVVMGGDAHTQTLVTLVSVLRSAKLPLESLN